MARAAFHLCGGRRSRRCRTAVRRKSRNRRSPLLPPGNCLQRQGAESGQIQPHVRLSVPSGRVSPRVLPLFTGGGPVGSAQERPPCPVKGLEGFRRGLRDAVLDACWRITDVNAQATIGQSSAARLMPDPLPPSKPAIPSTTRPGRHPHQPRRNSAATRQRRPRPAKRITHTPTLLPAGTANLNTATQIRCLSA